LKNWKKAPEKSGPLCHPREEHLVPLFVAAGASVKNYASIYEAEALGFNLLNIVFDK
jgi:aromatic ring-opening dioxygenase catalytic subunit (LigB family)